MVDNNDTVKNTSSSNTANTQMPNTNPGNIPSTQAETLIAGRYKIVKELNHGGIGVVYLATDVHVHNQKVVIKFLLDKSDKNPWLKKKFQDESLAMAKINHPSVAKVLDTGIIDGKSFFVVEFIDGASLRTLINKPGMDLRLSASIIRQVGEALTAIHRVGVYHRDLKPENIMIQSTTGGQYVKIIDFGIATVKESIDSETQLTEVAGTLDYMSIEQIEGKPSISSDIHALGVIAYEMLTASLPFNTRGNPSFFISAQKLMEQIKEGVKKKPSELRPEIPLEADVVILKALSYQPKQGFNSAQEFATELANALEANLSSGDLVFRDSSPKPLPEQKNNEIVDKKSDNKLDNKLDNERNLAPTNNNLNKLLITFISIIILIGIGIGYFYKNSSDNTPTPSPTNTTSITSTEEFRLGYWISIKESNLPLYGELSGAVYFRDDDQIRFNIVSPTVGNLYIINESPEPRADGKPSYTILFPKTSNPESAKISPNQVIALPENGWIGFSKAKGTEKVWLVWSKQLINELSKFSNTQNNGIITDNQDIDNIQKFLSNNQLNVQVEKDDTQKRTNLIAKQPVFAHMLKLEHR